MDLTAITVTELRYIVAVDELGHFGRAADACHVTQPTLSTQIRKLEDNLGVMLFERLPRRIRTTPAGDAIVAHARTVLAEIRAIGDAARGHVDPLSGALRLGVIPTLGPYLLPSLLAHAQRELPQLRLTVHETLTMHLLDELERGRLDAALLALPVRGSGWMQTALFDEPFWLLVPAAHPLATRSRIAESDLREHPVLLLADGHCLREQALPLCGHRGSSALDDFSATSLETLRHLVAAGVGVTLLPGLAVPALATVPAVVVRPFRAPQPSRRIGLVWRRGDPRTAGLQRLGAFIQAHLPAGAQAVPLPTGKAGAPSRHSRT